MSSAHDHAEALQRMLQAHGALCTSHMMSPSLAAAQVATQHAAPADNVRALALRYAELQVLMKRWKQIEAEQRRAEIAWLMDLSAKLRIALTNTSQELFVANQAIPRIEVQTPHGMVRVLRGGEVQRGKGENVKLSLVDATSLFYFACAQRSHALPPDVLNDLSDRWTMTMLLTTRIAPTVMLDAV